MGNETFYWDGLIYLSVSKARENNSEHEPIVLILISRALHFTHLTITITIIFKSI